MLPQVWACHHARRRTGSASEKCAREGENATDGTRKGGENDRRIRHRRYAAPSCAQRQVVRRLSGRIAQELRRRRGRGGADSHTRPPHPAPPAGRRPPSGRGLHGRRSHRGKGGHSRFHGSPHDQRGTRGLSRRHALAGRRAPPSASFARAQHPPPLTPQRGASL